MSMTLAQTVAVVAQLVEWSLTESEIRDSNPVMGNFYSLSTVHRKDENKEKETGNFIILVEFFSSFARFTCKNLVRYLHGDKNILIILTAMHYSRNR